MVRPRASPCVTDAADGPGPAELGRGALGIAVLQQAADAGRADRALRVGQLGDDGQAHAERLRRAARKATSPPRRWPKAKSAPQARCAAPIPSCSTSPRSRRPRAPRSAVERDLVEQLHAERRPARRPLGRERQAEGRVVRAEQLARVRLEGQHGERGAGPGGVGGAQEVGVAEMHAVEVAERHRGAAHRVGQVQRQVRIVCKVRPASMDLPLRATGAMLRSSNPPARMPIHADATATTTRQLLLAARRARRRDARALPTARRPTEACAYAVQAR